MFKDRVEAGQKLAERLKGELSEDDLKKSIVLAIPRGGIVVGKQISESLGLLMDCLITKKIPSPESEELAIGAVGEAGVVVWDEELCERLKVPVEYRQEIVRKKVLELEEKRNFFNCGEYLLQIKGKKAVIVDDGVATGSTVKAAIAVVNQFAPEEIIVTVPVIPKDSLAELTGKVGRLLYLEAPEMFFSVGQYYENFEQITDEQVKEILKV